MHDHRNTSATEDCQLLAVAGNHQLICSSADCTFLVSVVTQLILYHIINITSVKHHDTHVKDVKMQARSAVKERSFAALGTDTVNETSIGIYLY